MEQYLKPKDAGAVLGNVTTKTLANWRSLHIGPPYVKMNGKTVRYKISDLVVWAEEGRVETRGSMPGGRKRHG